MIGEEWRPIIKALHWHDSVNTGCTDYMPMLDGRVKALYYQFVPKACDCVSGCSYIPHEPVR